MAAETPTIVLVHGAWADATGFDAEIRALRARGYSAIGFGNPLRDLAGDSAYLGSYNRRSRNFESSLTFRDGFWRRTVGDARSTAQPQRT